MSTDSILVHKWNAIKEKVLALSYEKRIDGQDEIAVIFNVIRITVFNYKITNRVRLINDLHRKNVVKTDSSDVNEVSKPKLSRNQELIEQYRNLLIQGIISEEDFKKKEKELLEDNH